MRISVLYLVGVCLFIPLVGMAQQKPPKKGRASPPVRRLMINSKGAKTSRTSSSVRLTANAILRAQRVRAMLLEHLFSSAELQTFLSTISYAEGTYHKGIAGYGMFWTPRNSFVSSYRCHPGENRCARSGNKIICSTAVGRYQCRLEPWDNAARELGGINDFGPLNQDLVAAYLTWQAGALADVLALRIKEALQKTAYLWASLPTSNYGQPRKKLKDLLRFYYEHYPDYKEGMANNRNNYRQWR